MVREARTVNSSSTEVYKWFGNPISTFVQDILFAISRARVRGDRALLNTLQQDVAVVYQTSPIYRVRCTRFLHREGLIGDFGYYWNLSLRGMSPGPQWLV